MAITTSRIIETLEGEKTYCSCEMHCFYAHSVIKMMRYYFEDQMTYQVIDTDLLDYRESICLGVVADFQFLCRDKVGKIHSVICSISFNSQAYPCDLNIDYDIVKEDFQNE